MDMNYDAEQVFARIVHGVQTDTYTFKQVKVEMDALCDVLFAPTQWRDSMWSTVSRALFEAVVYSLLPYHAHTSHAFTSLTIYKVADFIDNLRTEYVHFDKYYEGHVIDYLTYWLVRQERMEMTPYRKASLDAFHVLQTYKTEGLHMFDTVHVLYDIGYEVIAQYGTSVVYGVMYKFAYQHFVRSLSLAAS